jgi:hypothetical protein
MSRMLIHGVYEQNQYDLAMCDNHSHRGQLRCLLASHRHAPRHVPTPKTLLHQLGRALYDDMNTRR